MTGDDGRTPTDLGALSRPELTETVPSEGTRKALGVAAEILIKRSKQVLDMAVRVTAHQPLQLSCDAIVEAGDIRQLLEALGDSRTYPPSQVVLMASNSIETLPLARQWRKHLTERLSGQGSTVTPGSELWKLAAPESPLNLLLTILSKIERREDLDGVEASIVEAEQQDPSFNHPVIADFMCSRCAERGDDDERLCRWLRKALYFRPLDRRHLSTLRAVGSDDDRIIAEQILELTRPEDRSP